MISIVQGYDFTFGGKRPMVKIGNVTFFDWRRIPGYYLLRLRGVIWRHFQEKHAALGGCENCGSFHGLHHPPSMTCYAWDGKGENPNATPKLCLDCAEDYGEYWEAMWAEYYAGQGY